MSDLRKIRALIDRHPFTGTGGRTIYEAPQTLADAFLKMLAEAQREAWDQGRKSLATDFKRNGLFGESEATPNPYGTGA